MAGGRVPYRKRREQKPMAATITVEETQRSALAIYWHWYAFAVFGGGGVS